MFKKSLLAVLFLSFTTTFVSGQFQKHELVYGGQMGLKLFGVFGVSDNTVFLNTRNKNKPAWQGTMDYGLTESMSVGLAYAVQVTDKVFSSGESTGDVVARAARVDVAARMLFHYGNNEDLDLYSGFRVGYKTDDLYQGNSPIPASSGSLVSGDRPTFGLVVFGLRYWLDDSVALTTEINWGRPYIINLGVATRFY